MIARIAILAILRTCPTITSDSSPDGSECSISSLAAVRQSTSEIDEKTDENQPSIEWGGSSEYQVGKLAPIMVMKKKSECAGQCTKKTTQAAAALWNCFLRPNFRLNLLEFFHIDSDDNPFRRSHSCST